MSKIQMQSERGTAMKSRAVKTSAIIVEKKRTREDLGDIKGLAASIKEHGLIQPIVVDKNLRLVAGGRRLKAIKKLRWEKVDVRLYGDLSRKERLELELEENLRRKDLTSIEHSRALERLAEVSRELAEEEKTLGPRPRVSKGKRGPAKDPSSDVSTAERIGSSPRAIHEAKQHVAAVKEFPEVEGLPKKQVIKIAKQLREMPPKEREETRRKMVSLPAEEAKKLKAKESAIDRKHKAARVLYKWINGCNHMSDVLSDFSMSCLLECFGQSDNEIDDILRSVRGGIDNLKTVENHILNMRKGVRRIR